MKAKHATVVLKPVETNRKSKLAQFHVFFRVKIVHPYTTLLLVKLGRLFESLKASSKISLISLSLSHSIIVIVPSDCQVSTCRVWLPTYILTSYYFINYRDSKSGATRATDQHTYGYAQRSSSYLSTAHWALLHALISTPSWHSFRFGIHCSTGGLVWPARQPGVGVAIDRRWGGCRGVDRRWVRAIWKPQLFGQRHFSYFAFFPPTSSLVFVCRMDRVELLGAAVWPPCPPARQATSTRACRGAKIGVKTHST